MTAKLGPKVWGPALFWGVPQLEGHVREWHAPTMKLSLDAPRWGTVVGWVPPQGPIERFMEVTQFRLPGTMDSILLWEDATMPEWARNRTILRIVGASLWKGIPAIRFDEIARARLLYCNEPGARP